ncbi:hypothetical protein, partial [Nitrosomonas sp. Is37]|uniref:hypothetical protein n=1 Tax=Nitrosomonas sp. Is37 TaxID=3080535 RepID=UPI00294AB02B
KLRKYDCHGMWISVATYVKCQQTLGGVPLKDTFNDCDTFIEVFSTSPPPRALSLLTSRSVRRVGSVD